MSFTITDTSFTNKCTHGIIWQGLGYEENLLGHPNRDRLDAHLCQSDFCYYCKISDKYTWRKKDSFGLRISVCGCLVPLGLGLRWSRRIITAGNTWRRKVAPLTEGRRQRTKNPFQRHAPKDASSDKVLPPQVSCASQQPLCFEAIQIKHSRGQSPQDPILFESLTSEQPSNRASRAH